jgi:Protein of unknown function (DUF2469)
MASRDDLEEYEADIELKLYQEYRAVMSMFAYVVETDRRFYLANEVDKRVVSNAGTTHVELELRDAWVWDLYRQNRFVSQVSIVSFRDVNVETLPTDTLEPPAPA